MKKTSVNDELVFIFVNTMIKLPKINVSNYSAISHKL